MDAVLEEKSRRAGLGAPRTYGTPALRRLGSLADLTQRGGCKSKLRDSTRTSCSGTTTKSNKTR